MLPKPISVLNAPFETFARRCKPTCTVHNRPPIPDVCAICVAPLWGVANADDDGEGGDYTERAGEVNMPPDLEKEVRERLGPNRFNRLVNPSRLRAPPDMWAPRHQEGRPANRLPVQSLSCDHWFHQECIMQAAAATPNNPTCPQCRVPIRADDLRDMGLGDLVPEPPAPVPALAPGEPLTVPQAQEQLVGARGRERDEAVERRLMRSMEADAQRIQRHVRQREQATQRQRKQVDRLRMSVAKQQIKKWDQVVKDDARRETAERKRVLANTKLVRVVDKQNVAMRRGYNAGEETRLDTNVAMARAQLDIALDTLLAIPEPDHRRADEAGSWRGKLFLLLREHQLMLAEADNRLLAAFEESRRAIWDALRILRDMYAYSDAVRDSGNLYGLAGYIHNIVQEDYGEAEARHPNRTASLIQYVLARTLQTDEWREGGQYQIRNTQGHHWYVDSTYAEVTRGLWIVDPLVPLPDETEAPQWPPAPQGAVTIPSEVSIWFTSGVPAVWRPSGLVGS